MNTIPWLRGYLGAIGVAIGLANVLLFIAAKDDWLGSALQMVGIWLGAAFGYGAIALPTLLRQSSAFLRLLPIGGAGFMLLEFFTHWLSGAVLTGDVVKLAIALGLAVHLFQQIRQAQRPNHSQLAKPSPSPHQHS